MNTLLALLLLLAQDDADEWLIAGPLQMGGRTPLFVDPVLAKGGIPKAGDTVGNRTWTAQRMRDEIRSPALRPGYAYRAVRSDRERVAICAVRGASSFFVNGEPFVGDVYSHGYVRVPVLLRQGDNHVLARCGRGSFAMKFEDAPAPLVINPHDATLPDMIQGEPIDAWGAVPILNATTETARGAVLRVGDAKVDVPALPPLGILKVPFPIRAGPELRLTLGTHEEKLTLRVREKGQTFKRTFKSAIDGSVQYCAVLPPANFDPKKPVALVLTLHGASVEAVGLPDCYTPREWCVVVAATNRRPFGFDWEDWGRLDALEVLDLAQKDYRIDPARVYLTGHSMGGHGTWHLSAQYPDRFAAAGPSAGWISFWTYGGLTEPKTPMEQLFHRAVASSDTLALLRNVEPLPLFVLHGDKDDDVPVGETQRLAKELEPFHRDLRVHYEKDGSHWWDRPGTPGTDCVNFAELFDFFQRRRRPDVVDRFDFRTFSPAVSSRHEWAEIMAQPDPHVLSRVRVEGGSVQTENVSHLRLRRGGAVEIDGQKFQIEKIPADFVRDATWRPSAPEGLRKTPELYGPFKQAFHHPFLLVYGTAGAAEETQAGLAKARFDAEVWWYRGNGFARVVADADVTPQLAGTHTLVLYGNEETNATWKKLAPQLPLRATKGLLAVGEDRLPEDVAFVALYPSPLLPDRFVAFVGATGPGGRRAWAAANWFFSGAGFPDVAAWDASVFEKGLGAVRLAGYFGADWKPHATAWFSRREY